MPAYITSSDLIAKIGAAEFNQLFDDNGDGLADTSTVTSLIVEASSYADTFLIRAFKTTNVGLAADPRFKGAVADICIQIAGERRREWLNDDGKGPHEARGARGRETIKNLVAGFDRLGMEEQFGANKTIGGSQDPPPVVDFVFAPNRNNRQGPGGF